MWLFNYYALIKKVILKVLLIDFFNIFIENLNLDK